MTTETLNNEPTAGPQDGVVIGFREYHKAADVMGQQFVSTDSFIARSAQWLANQFGDLHLEFHKDYGWQVSTCYADEKWGEDTWITGDGTIQGCLCAAVLRSR